MIQWDDTAFWDRDIKKLLHPRHYVTQNRIMLTTRSDHIVAAEYRDLQTNAMAVDSQGKFALLASKRCIALGKHETVMSWYRFTPTKTFSTSEIGV